MTLRSADPLPRALPAPGQIMLLAVSHSGSCWAETSPPPGSETLARRGNLASLSGILESGNWDENFRIRQRVDEKKLSSRPLVA